MLLKVFVDFDVVFSVLFFEQLKRNCQCFYYFLYLYLELVYCGILILSTCEILNLPIYLINTILMLLLIFLYLIIKLRILIFNQVQRNSLCLYHFLKLFNDTSHGGLLSFRLYLNIVIIFLMIAVSDAIHHVL